MIRLAGLLFFFYSLLSQGETIPGTTQVTTAGWNDIDVYDVWDDKKLTLSKNEGVFELKNGINQSAPTKPPVILIYELSEKGEKTAVDLFTPTAIDGVIFDYSNQINIVFEDVVTSLVSPSEREMAIRYTDHGVKRVIVITGEAKAFPVIDFSDQMGYPAIEKENYSTYYLGNKGLLSDTTTGHTDQALSEAGGVAVGIITSYMLSEILFLFSAQDYSKKPDLVSIAYIMRGAAWIFGFPMMEVQELLGQLIFYYIHREKGGISLFRYGFGDPGGYKTIQGYNRS